MSRFGAPELFNQAALKSKYEESIGKLTLMKTQSMHDQAQAKRSKRQQGRQCSDMILCIAVNYVRGAGLVFTIRL